MKSTTILIIALALCMCFVLPVSAVGKYYENKYVETDAFNEQQYIDTVTGVVFGQVRSGYNTLTSQIGIRNVLTGENGTFGLYPINPDGTFEQSLIPGRFEICLFNSMGKQDGNGGQPECVFANVVANIRNQPERELLGHAVSGDSTCTPFYTIESATYGLGHCSDIIIHHGDYNREWVSGYCARYWRGVCVDYRPGRWDYDYVGIGNGDYIKNHQQRGHDSEEYSYIAPTTECKPDGEVIDVTSNVQNAVAQGATEFFFFDNAQHPGGIFGIAGNLLSEINDPAPGFVKNVCIRYSNGCGMEKSIKAMEYDHINLVTGTVTQETT